jgi:hypothetical protein
MQTNLLPQLKYMPLLTATTLQKVDHHAPQAFGKNDDRRQVSLRG